MQNVICVSVMATLSVSLVHTSSLLWALLVVFAKEPILIVDHFLEESVST